VPTVEHYMQSGAWFAGTSDQLVEKLKRFEERYFGLETINFSPSVGTPLEAMLEPYQRLAEEAMPHFAH
jgi:hypothetical protein